MGLRVVHRSRWPSPRRPRTRRAAGRPLGAGRRGRRTVRSVLDTASGGPSARFGTPR